MVYVYVLQSEKDHDLYTGCTINLMQRVSLHNKGRVKSTKDRRPLKLVYYEGCIDKKDARKREIYLKTSWGKRYLKNRLKNYLHF